MLAALPVSDAVALVAGESSSDLLLAAESGSLYASSDAGSSWSAVGAVPASDVTALVGRQGTYLLFTSSGSVFRSVDAGVGWTPVGTITASDVKAAASQATAWTALATTGGVYRSTDDGATWNSVGPGTRSCSRWTSTGTPT